MANTAFQQYLAYLTQNGFSDRANALKNEATRTPKPEWQTMLRREIEEHPAQNLEATSILASGEEYYSSAAPTSSLQKPVREEEPFGVENYVGLGKGIGRGQTDLEKAALANTNNRLETEIEKEQETRLMATLNQQLEGKSVFNEDGSLNEEGLRLASNLDTEGLLEHQRIIADETFSELVKQTEDENQKEEIKKLAQERQNSDDIRKKTELEDTPEKKTREEQREKDRQTIQSRFKSEYQASYSHYSTLVDPTTKKLKYSRSEAAHLAYREAYRKALKLAQQLTTHNRKVEVLGNTNAFSAPIFTGLTGFLSNQDRRRAEQEQREKDAKIRKLRSPERETAEEAEDEADNRPPESPVSTKTTRREPAQERVTRSRGFGGKFLRKLLIGGEAAAAPEEAVGIGTIVLIVLGVILAIALFAAIIYFFNQSSKESPPSLVTINCGDSFDPTQGSTTDILATGQIISNKLSENYHIGLSGQAKDKTKRSVDADMKIYTTICKLFGHYTGSPYVDHSLSFNTFGKLVVGNWGNSSGQPIAPKVVISLVFDNKWGPCAMSQQIKNSPLWLFANPDKCIADPWQLEFRIAWILAQSLIQQEQYTKSRVFENFQQIFSQPLPSINCLGAKDASTQLKNCFADMVGEYLTYYTYLDLNYPIPTPPATGSAQTFQDYPTSFGDYYNFARIKLFDGAVFFASQSASPDIVNNAKYISDNNCRTFVGIDSSHPSINPCDAENWNLYDNIDPGQKYPQPLKIIPLTTITIGSAKYPIGNRFFSDGHRVRPWGRYWCTDLVIDSYALSGQVDLYNDPVSGNVTGMMNFFKINKAKGYYFIPRDEFDPAKIPPGSAIFFRWPTEVDPSVLGDHTALVSMVQPNEKHPRNGQVFFYQANGPTRIGSANYSNGRLESDVVGFGIKIAPGQ